MEVRNRVGKCREGSPERKKVWTERSPRYQQCRKVPVVYYLCRNHRLEHPHFMEVPLSSPDGLYLRDVIERLNVLRGRGMAYLYSWSCKRSYKTGFVWYDLCEGDSVIPAHGNEYVLKGSELFEESDSGHFSPIGNAKTQHLKPLREPVSSRRLDESSSSSSLNGKDEIHNPEDNTTSPPQFPAPSCVSPDYRAGKNSSWVGTLNLTELKVHKKGRGASDASTQTDENDTKCVSCEEPEAASKQNSEVNAQYSVSGAMSDTLETLIRADARKMKSSKIGEDGELQMPSKLKATNLLMQLISCGSMSVKDGSFGLIPGYNKPAKASPSPLFSTSVLFGECNCLSQKSSFMTQKLEDKEYFSGSAIETGTFKDKTEHPAALKRSSSFNATDWELREEESNSSGSNCIPRSIKASLSKHPKSESMRYSPVSSGPRNSTEGTRFALSNGVSGPSASSSSRMDMDSFREDENVIRIEERLASGAQVIIQSRT